jgi:hypothetical protein
MLKGNNSTRSPATQMPTEIQQNREKQEEIANRTKPARKH